MGWIALLALVVILGACGRLEPADDLAAGDLEIGIIVLTSSDTRAADHRALQGATISGTAHVLVTAGARVAAIAFHLDDPAGTGEPAAVSDAEPFVLTLDSTQLADGTHQLTVVASLHDGRAKAATAQFVVHNGPDAPSDPQNPPGDEPGGTPPGGSVPIWSPDELPPATLYVATDGSDANDGRSPDRPLRTIQRAADIVQPGDVVYLRGGVYPVQVGFNTSGTASQPIVWTSHPGEWAILDGADQVPVESAHRVWVTNVSWNVFMNFEVRYSPREGIWINNSHDNVFRNLITHGNHYSGITNYMSNRNRFEYIVTYDNYDVYNEWGKPGDDADGISVHTGDGNVVYRVVAFSNSDDGIDAWRSTNTVIDSSISFGNGRGTHGNGNGIKAGGNYEANHTVVRNSLSFDNRSNGFDYNSGQYVTFLNNTSLGNGGYDFVGDGTTRLHNNLATDAKLSIGGATASHNSWNLGIYDARFLSLDRDAPDFLSLAADSPAIDTGLDVGLSYTGAAPDLGALPYGESYGQLVAPLRLTDIVAGSEPLADTILAVARTTRAN